MSRLLQFGSSPSNLRSLTSSLTPNNVIIPRSSFAKLPGQFNLLAKRYQQLTKGPLKVKLLANIPRLGVSGQVIEVPAGRMRYELYPHKLAQYVVKERKQICRRQIESSRGSIRGAREEALDESEENVLLSMLKIKKSNKPGGKKTGSSTGTINLVSGADGSLSNYIKLAKLHDSLRHLPVIEFFKSSKARTQADELLALSQPNNESNKGEALYGSVTLEEVLREVREKHQVALDKEWVKLDKIKRTGEYLAEIDLGNNLGLAWLRIKVIPEREKQSYLDNIAAEAQKEQNLKPSKV